MFTQQEYLWAWAFYAGGLCVFMLGWWKLTAGIKWREVKHVLRLMVFVALAVPWFTDKTGEYLSPAWIVTGIESAFEGGDAFTRGGVPLIAALLAAMIFATIVYIFIWMFGRFKQS